MQVTRIYIAVEEKLLGFILVSKRAPSCTEAAVLLNVWTLFVLNFDELYNLTVRSEWTRPYTSRHCKYLRNFMLYSFYRKTGRQMLWFSNIAKFSPSCRNVAVNYRFGAFSFIKTNKSNCSSQTSVLGPSLVLPSCLGLKTETYYRNLYRACTEAAVYC